jgi:hypothetical protein
LSRVSSTLVTLMGVAFGAAMATPVVAQGTPESRVAVSLTGGYQTNATTFSQTVAFEQYSEPGSVTSTYTVRRRPVGDVGVTVRVWRNLGIGISGSSLRDSGSAQVSALIPNPFVFGQLRPVNGPADVSHRELDLHFQAAYWARLSDRLEIIISGGPSRFRVDQDFVSDVAFSETDPFDTATYEGASVVRQRQTVMGANIGGEAGWRIARHLALAGAVRFSRAKADFPGTSAEGVVVGGLHVGGGVHLLF